MEYYLALRKKWNSAICNNMDEPREYHFQCSQTEKDKYHIHVESKK